MSLSIGIWLGVALAKVIALAATWRPNLDRGLVCVRWYLLLSLGGDLATFWILNTFGYRSLDYKFAYYISDLAIVILGFIVLVRLVELAFQHSSLPLKGIRTVALLVFAGIAVSSGAIVLLMRGELLITGFAHEMEQNFSFLGMILAVLLFVGLNIMQVPGVRFRRIVLAFSLLYASGAIVYSLEAVIPGALAGVYYFLVPASSLIGMALIAYSLWQPEPERKPRTSRMPELARVSGASSW